MTRVLVLWEDELHLDLSDLANLRLAARCPGFQAVGHTVLHRPAKGRLNFANFVAKTWPDLCRSAGARHLDASDHVICVIDGDGVGETVASIPPIPQDAAAIDAWHSQAEPEWEGFVRAAATAGTPHDTIHGLILRWNKESVILAGFDEPNCMRQLRIDVGRREVVAYLEQCAPGAADLRKEAFTNQYRQPLACLRRLQEESGKPGLRKNDFRYDKALRDLATNYRDVVCARAPDIDRLVDRLAHLTRA